MLVILVGREYSMKVIRRTILDKINEEIDKNFDDILRIELRNMEFLELITLLEDEVLDTNKITRNTFYSRYYLMYKGILIQTHEDYE
jgi:hypothetical protein